MLFHRLHCIPTSSASSPSAMAMAAMEISSSAAPDSDSAGAFSRLTQALSGANTLRGVELDARHVLLHQFHSMFTLLLWILVFAARIILSLLRTLVPVPVLTKTLQKLTTLAEEFDLNSAIPRTDVVNYSPLTVSRSPVGRALTQVLSLMNDVPASSNKHVFLQDLADRLIEENRVEGVKFDAINEAALTRGFARTINLLGQSLESRQQHDSFLSRLMRRLPSRALLPIVTFPGPFTKIRSLIGNILSSTNLWIPRSNPNEGAHLTNLADADMTEKLAKELLWIAEKLQGCGGMEEAVQQWSSVPSLAELSLCASPRVQKSLVRLSVLLCKSVVGNTNIPQEVCIQLVLLWLPLLCNATHGGDGPIFNTMEKREAERQMVRLVESLPETDQEQILSSWLQEYAMSQSDWPNLGNCYDTWCYSMRKLEVGMSKAMNE